MDANFQVSSSTGVVGEWGEGKDRRVALHHFAVIPIQIFKLPPRFAQEG